VRSILTSRKDIEVCGEASDGREAIRKALELRPELIILDLTMPVMGGFAAAAELRQLLPEMPILFYSMHEGAQLTKEVKLARPNEPGSPALIGRPRCQPSTQCCTAVMPATSPDHPQ
jgi:DNA-binding NarL/FixJ family response regulator